MGWGGKMPTLCGQNISKALIIIVCEAEHQKHSELKEVRPDFQVKQQPGSCLHLTQPKTRVKLRKVDSVVERGRALKCSQVMIIYCVSAGGR